MVRFALRASVLLLVIGSLAIGLASSAAIGLATAKGAFRVDGATVARNSTLFEGALVETSAVPSTVALAGGVRMQLGSASRGKVYRDRLVLEEGDSQIDNGAGFRIEARGLQVQPGGNAYVALEGGDRVLVAAASAPVRVTTGEGILLASLAPGTSLSFTPQAAGAAAPFTVTGCLVGQNGRFLVTDRLANVTLEVRGPNLNDHSGFQVEITGTALKDVQPAAGASGVIQAVKLRRLQGSCAVPSAKRQATGSSTGSTAMSRRTKAIIAGVVVAGAGAGAAVAVSDSEEPKKPISR